MDIKLQKEQQIVNEQLDELFCEWMQEAEKHGDCNFVCDGMVNGFNDWAGRENAK